MEDTNLPQVTGRGASPSPEPLGREVSSVIPASVVFTDSAEGTQYEKCAATLAAAYGGSPEDMLSRVKMIEALRIQYGPKLKWIAIANCDVTHDPKVMFVLKDESPKDLVERYMRVFHAEAEQFRLEVVREKLQQNDPKGFTQSREMLLFVQAPHKLRELLKILDPSYWEDEKNSQKIREDNPLLSGRA